MNKFISMESFVVLETTAVRRRRRRRRRFCI